MLGSDRTSSASTVSRAPNLPKFLPRRPKYLRLSRSSLSGDVASRISCGCRCLLCGTICTCSPQGGHHLHVTVALSSLTNSRSLPTIWQRVWVARCPRSHTHHHSSLQPSAGASKGQTAAKKAGEQLTGTFVGAQREGRRGASAKNPQRSPQPWTPCGSTAGSGLQPSFK